MTPVHSRVASLIKEILHQRGRTVRSVGASESTLWRITNGRRDYLLSSLVTLADTLGFDVVINLRERAA